jgi:hypothetical protein
VPESQQALGYGEKVVQMAARSATGPQDRFEYAAGPSCTAALSCDGISFGDAQLLVTCPEPVDFYDPDMSGPPVTTSTTYTTYTAAWGAVSACDSTTGSCTAFTKSGGLVCGPPPPPSRSCADCDANGGICVKHSNGTVTCVYQ